MPKGTLGEGVHAITLFVVDLAAARTFCIEVFGLPLHDEGPNSAGFTLGETLINLLGRPHLGDREVVASYLVPPITAQSPMSQPTLGRERTP